MSKGKIRIEFVTKRDPHLTIKGWHHGFIGAIMFCVGLWAVLESPLRELWIIIPAALDMAAGLYLAADDGYQHIRQHWQKGYRSPVNKKWGQFLRWRRRRAQHV